MDLGQNYLVGIWAHLDILGGVCHREERVEPRERVVIVLLFLGLGQF